MHSLWRLTLTIETLTAFHTLGPGRTLPLVDRPIQVDVGGYPYVPGSLVRGRVRAHLERLLRTLGRPVCRPPRPEQTCPHYEAIQAQLSSLAEPYCMACRIFGSAWRDSAVHFGNFHLGREDLSPAEVVDVRTSVGISRRLGSAQAERLFTSQTTVPGARAQFRGEIHGQSSDEELGWFLVAVRLVTHLGGDKARGMGRVQLQVAQLSRWDTSGAWALLDFRPIVKGVMDRAAV